MKMYITTSHPKWSNKIRNIPGLSKEHFKSSIRCPLGLVNPFPHFWKPLRLANCPGLQIPFTKKEEWVTIFASQMKKDWKNILLVSESQASYRFGLLGTKTRIRDRCSQYSASFCFLMFAFHPLLELLYLSHTYVIWNKKNVSHFKATC